MLASNKDDIYDMNLETATAVQAMRKELEELPIPTRWQIALIWRRSGLEAKIHAEIVSAKFMQRASDWIEGI